MLVPIVPKHHGLVSRTGSMGSLVGWEMWQARLCRSLLMGCSFHFPCGFPLGGVGWGAGGTGFPLGVVAES